MALAGVSPPDDGMGGVNLEDDGVLWSGGAAKPGIYGPAGAGAETPDTTGGSATPRLADREGGPFGGGGVLPELA